MVKAELIFKRGLKSTMYETMFEYKASSIPGNSSEIIELDLIADDDPSKYEQYPIKPFNEGRFVNFEVLTENMIKFSCALYSSQNLEYDGIILEYVDIQETERLSDDTLNRYYTNRDEDRDSTIYLKLNNQSSLPTGEITIRFVCVNVTQVGRI